MDKLKKLKHILKNMGSVLVAYSGGVDSSFLLKVASDILGNKVLAVTADSAIYPAEELAFSKKMTSALGVKHLIIKTAGLKNKRFKANPINRCYYCKKDLFSRLKLIALKNKINFVVDASSVSDKKDFRPGSIAKKELGIRSPLEEAGFTKEDIRRFSKKLGLDSWDKPNLACLASRIPYYTEISKNTLLKIKQAENFLRGLGFKQVRLRHYNSLCRIEVPKDKITVLISKRNLVIEKLKRLGYNYITVDLEGYRSGSINEVIKK